ncbi:MAG: hypothetical protein P8Y64_12610 [Gammaproteobacteria bacterium]|jgi:hypothetical protein
MTDLKTFRDSLAGPQPPADCPVPLQALWHAAQGAWDRAHELVQRESGPQAAWVHAYLHRVEGDLGNARYWYHRAGRSPATGDLEAEWTEIVEILLNRPD